ncbi:hypothetical protein [Salinicola sp. DM10]|uniref:hypothetical protein n=1 Tax=Salinicola sp. DM10 TaxID=2815721 RepID=UPI001AC5948F|nr:hypothetical protein [Salinicola sp. DM10]MCE3027427.1 hypothetical protein [Salinicola sp. DM10]
MARPLTPSNDGDAAEWIVVDTAPTQKGDGAPGIISHHAGQEAARKLAEKLNQRQH